MRYLYVIDLSRIMCPHWGDTDLLKSLKRENRIHISCFRGLELFSEFPQNAFYLILKFK